MWLKAAACDGFIIMWIHFRQRFLLLFFITVFYCVHVICAHAIDLTDGKCYFTYINLKDVLSEIILREFFSCIPVLYG